MKIGSKHYILIIFSILALVIPSLGYYLMYRNVLSQGMTTGKAFAELAYQNDIKKDENELLETYKDSEKDRKNIENMIVSEEKVADFVDSIEKIGESTGVSMAITTLNIEKDSKSKGNVIIVKISANGPWLAIMKTLSTLENMPYAIYLNNLKLNTGSGDIAVPNSKSGAGKWSISADIKVLSSNEAEKE